MAIQVLDVGGKNGKNARSYFPDAEITVVDKADGWDVMEKGLPNGEWDVVFLSHIIEHVTNPDYLLDECKRVVGKSGTIIIATPNLGAWFNRILLLLGYQPHFTEVSTLYDVGKFRLGKEEKPGGHLRICTARALKQLLLKHDFRIKEFKGKPIGYKLPPILKQVDAFFGLFPSTAAELRVKCGYWD